MQPYYGISIDKQDTEHLYIQVYKHLRTLIFNNSIKPHEKLPPIRKLAVILGVNNVTVVNAYKLLEEDALVYKKVGSGTYVAPVEEEIDSERDFEARHRSVPGTPAPVR